MQQDNQRFPACKNVPNRRIRAFVVCEDRDVAVVSLYTRFVGAKTRTG